jgi:hypothetical protein
VVFILIEYDKNLQWYKNVLLTFGDHARDSIQICCWKNWKRKLCNPCVIKLMEDEKGKVEVDELDLGLCLIHVLFIILPCGFIELLETYKVGQEENKSNKITIMGAKHVNVFLHLFTCYE